MKSIYIVRHCQAEGQSAEAPLTAVGREQAEALSRFFADIPIDRIISSPFARAQATIQPLARQRGIKVQLDDRLIERVLSKDSMPDWFERLRDTFVDLDLCFPGGESSRTAMMRAVSAVEDVLRDGAGTTIMVTHGALMTLLLKHLDDRFGFSEWQQLTNPDVFLITLSDEESEVRRIWKD